MTSTKKPYSGSCLCGFVTFEVDDIESRMGHCHCSMCRKFHGAEFATYGEATRENFRWTDGAEYLKEYIAKNGTKRKFCSNCGSSLAFSPASNPEGLVEFSLGALDTLIEIRPDAHVFVDSKATWSTITDDLPQFAEGRDSAQKAK